MKKSKIALAVFLAVVLLAVSLCVPAFSWFTKPKARTGNELSMAIDDLNAYNAKTVTMSTEVSTDGENYSAASTSADFSGSNIAKNGRKYYRTTLTNGGTLPQNVSLYISSLSIGQDSLGKISLGVNDPTRMYKDYFVPAEEAVKSARDTKRIYFQPRYNNTDSQWELSDPTTDIIEVYYGKYDASVQKDMTYLGEFANVCDANDNSTYQTFCADISDNADYLYFKIKGSNSTLQKTKLYEKVSSNGCTPASSKVFTSIDENGGFKHVNGYRDIQMLDAGGMNVMNAYSELLAKKNDTVDASISSSGDSPDCFGGTVSYASSNTNKFTVNSSTGVITGVGVGTATLITTVTGTKYNDTLEIRTDVTVSEADAENLTDLTIVKNVQIPAAPDSNETDETPNVIVIDWYIKNSATNASDTLSYTMTGVYLGL